MRIPVDLLFEDGARMRVVTRDVSASGVFLFVSGHTRLHDSLRFLITFPREITTSCELCALCDGVVVRRETAPDSQGLAVRIQRYQFLNVSS